MPFFLLQPSFWLPFQLGSSFQLQFSSFSQDINSTRTQAFSYAQFQFSFIPQLLHQHFA
jgi:hypothetical protein